MGGVRRRFKNVERMEGVRRLGNVRRLGFVENVRRLWNVRRLGSVWMRRLGNVMRKILQVLHVKRRVGDMCIRRLDVVRRLGAMWKRLLSTMYHTGLSRLRGTTFMTYLLTRFQQFS